jgi:NADH dehydrogenase
MRRQANTRVLMGEVTRIDVARKVVILAAGPVAYDYLVVATGATHGYFGRDEWAAHAPGLKTLDDATAIRRRILLAFERAEMASNPAESARLLTVAIVGGGPTGVELAGAVAELARRALARDFRVIDPRQTRVLLIEAGPRLLANFPEELSRYTSFALARLGVEVRLGRAVTHCGPEGVHIGHEAIRAGTVVWAAGVAASPAARWLGVEAERAGRVPVTPDLRAPGLEDVWVIGDTALARDPDGAPQPGIAPVAKQQGAYVARAIAARVAGDRPPPPFVYRDRGLLATIGRKAAVIAYKRLRIRGWIAWWLWGAAHVYFLVSLRNRLIVVTQWLWSYLLFERGARLITGTDAARN